MAPVTAARPRTPTLLRGHLGAALRRRREEQRRTLRDVAASADVSLGYLSEVERGVKEASSELLSAICRALDVRLADVLVEVADTLYRLEVTTSGSAAVAPVELVPVGAEPVASRQAPSAAPQCRSARAA